MKFRLNSKKSEWEFSCDFVLRRCLHVKAEEDAEVSHSQTSF